MLESSRLPSFRASELPSLPAIDPMRHHQILIAESDDEQQQQRNDQGINPGRF